MLAWAKQKARARRAGGCEECVGRSPHKGKINACLDGAARVLFCDSLDFGVGLFAHAQLLGLLVNLAFGEQ